MANSQTSHKGAHLRDFSRHTSELRQSAATLGHDVEELGKISKKIAGDWEESLEARIRKNPLQSLLIAAGVGLVLGAVWKSR
jgi:ElaB/YqjD/DUF883 family membrane-anchored ribosome-binding protein